MGKKCCPTAIISSLVVNFWNSTQLLSSLQFVWLWQDLGNGKPQKKFLEDERCSFYKKIRSCISSPDQLAKITLLVVWLVSKNLAKTTLFVKLKSFLFYVVIMTFLFESYFFHYIIHIGVYFRHYIWAYIWRNMSWSQVIGVEKGWKLS